MKRRGLSLFVPLVALAACSAPRTERALPPVVAPAAPLHLPEGGAGELAQPAPLHHELLAIDLDTAVRVAAATRMDVELARVRVESAAADYEARTGALFPSLSPQILYESIEGHVRGIDGPLLAADFESLAPSLLLRWVLNPGKAIYERVAARRRLESAEHEERHAVQQAVTTAALQYYELALSSARLAVAERALRESEETLRLAQARRRAGTGRELDVAMAEGELARRRQDVVRALDRLYDASIELASTLRLDPAVTLVPSESALETRTLVDPERSLDELLELAIQWREDLAALRSALEAAQATHSAGRWQMFGPQLDLGYQFGSIRSETPGATYSTRSQDRVVAGAGLTLSPSAPGFLRGMSLLEDSASLAVQRRFEAVRAEVVRASRACRSAAERLPLARAALNGAEARLRLARAAVEAGTAVALEVLQAEQVESAARLNLSETVVHHNRAQVELLAALGLADEAAVLRPHVEAVGDAAP